MNPTIIRITLEVELNLPAGAEIEEVVDTLNGNLHSAFDQGILSTDVPGEMILQCSGIHFQG